MKETIFLIAGPSGSGKSAVAEKLAAQYGLKQVKSYTTRKPRPGEGDAYHFVDPIQFQKFRDMTNITIYHNHFYGVRIHDMMHGDMYIVDPPGITYMRNHYSSSMNIYAIGILATPEERLARFTARGDNYNYAKSRIENDKQTFDIPPETYDIAIHNKDLDDTVNIAYQFIKAMKEKTEQQNRIEIIKQKQDFEYLSAAYQRLGNQPGVIVTEGPNCYMGYIQNEPIISSKPDVPCPFVPAANLAPHKNHPFFIQPYYSNGKLANISVQLSGRPDPLFTVNAPITPDERTI